jgi:hypothetical protein
VLRRIYARAAAVEAIIIIIIIVLVIAQYTGQAIA